VLEMADMHGALTLTLVDARGNVIQHQHRRNRIVRTGRRLVAQLFGGISSGAAPTRVTHVAVGTDGTAATDDDVGMRAPRAPRKPIADVSYTDFVEPVAGSPEGLKRTRVSLTAVFDFNEANDAVPLREAGVFTDPTAGIMYNRVVFDPVTKTNAFRLTLLWDIVF
jgi:hypothetical protein